MLEYPSALGVMLCQLVNRYRHFTEAQ